VFKNEKWYNLQKTDSFKYMKLQEIIKSLPAGYDPALEKELALRVKTLQAGNLTDELADLLSFAISEGYNELAKTILEKDYNGKKIEIENVNKAIIDQSPEDYSLLHYTAQFGNKEMLLYFLKQGVSVTLDKDQLSPLHVLTFAKNLSKQDIIAAIEGLEKASKDIINQRDAFYLTALHYAAHNDNKAALEALVHCGAQH